MRKDFIFTSESVSEGHPDKVSDRISDMVVDHFIAKDPFARVACETLTTTNKVVLAGEVRGPVEEDKDEIVSKVRECIKDIGYEQEGFHWQNADVQYLLHGQSADIAMGVDSANDKDEGAGDQGIMFGYACTETPELMPAPIYYSHKILELMAKGRKDGSLQSLEPDSKSQVTLRYVDDKPHAVTSVVISTQHTEGLSPADVKKIVTPVLHASIPANLLNDLDDQEYYVNPTGNFVIGGPDGDTGLTGRKIIVDTYGGAAPHGGGAFSGKDPTKVDRSAAYASRYLAKNIVAAGLSTQCTIQLSYAIGVAKPLSIYVNTQGTNTIDEAKIEAAIPEIMNLSPKGIREKLQLNKPIYEQTAAYGHFGRTHNSASGAFSWEALDLVSDFKSLA
ncbi:methionine adenosyltransferase [Alphaproteobacteria bacterium]|nr:methionine adenosyltransferase [Alphaproteobacteria bacterium]